MFRFRARATIRVDVDVPGRVVLCLVLMVCRLSACFASAAARLPNGQATASKSGQNYRQARLLAAVVADNWIDSDDPRVLSQPPEYPDWWSVFQDPVLNDLVETAYQQNLTLREAGLRVSWKRGRSGRSLRGTCFLKRSSSTGSYTREQISTVLQQPLLAPHSRVIQSQLRRLVARWQPELGTRHLGSVPSGRSKRPMPTLDVFCSKNMMPCSSA